MTLVKVAVLREWTRIFVPKATRNYFYWSCHISICLITLGGILLFVLINVKCSPYAANWDIYTPGANCLFDVSDLTLSSAVINTVFEMIPLVLPQKIIWGLRLSISKKIGVSLVFCVGLLYAKLMPLLFTIITGLLTYSPACPFAP